MSRTKAIYGIFALLLFIMTGAIITLFLVRSGDNNERPLVFEVNLEEPARAFLKMAESNRCDEACRLLNALPKCPEISQKTTASGALVAYDYSKPTYRLTRSKLVQLLGKPHSETSTSCSYVIATDADANPMWFLLIQCHDDYVVNSFMYSASPRAKWLGSRPFGEQ